MKIDKRIRYTSWLAILIFAAYSIIGIMVNAYRLEEIRIELQESGVEHKDKTLLMVGKEDQAPDYRLRVRVGKYWRDLGTYGNTWIGDGLRFVPGDTIPYRKVSEIQLLDDDKLESDVLEQFPLEGPFYSGNNYQFEISTTWDLEAGVDWFFGTPIGMAICAGITIAVLVLVFSIFA